MIYNRVITHVLCGVIIGLWATANLHGESKSETILRAKNKAEAVNQFRTEHPANVLYESGGRITRVYGAAFSTGQSPKQSADAFCNEHLRMWGLRLNEVEPVGPFPDSRHMQPLMYDRETDSYKFTGIYYRQVCDGLPVFQSRLTLVVRNEPGFPLVLASADLRDIGSFQVDENVLANAKFAQHRAAAVARFGPAAQFMKQELSIWAGSGNDVAQPRLAEQSVVVNDNGSWLLLTDAMTGEILHEESMIHFESVSGNVSGMSTEGIGAEQCENEVSMPLPYLLVSSGASVSATDDFGDFTIDAQSKTINATLTGLWFGVTNFNGPNAQASTTAATPANIEFNTANFDEQVRAQVNAYVGANEVRDYVLQYNPSYPTINQGGFPIFVNRVDGFCPGNAWYDSTFASLNFCESGGGQPNTAWSSVIYHEYGHHLVEAGGSGQGEYGEGMSDVISALLLDSPLLGLGFFGSCSTSLRSANNNCQYQTIGCSSCGDEIHICGQILSGCVWSTRDELINSGFNDYTDILSSIAINSILIHTGSSVDPSITVDFLTLDDDNADICDGTPHYDEIAAGFSAHNMDAPPLVDIRFEYPNGLTELVTPDGTTVVRVEVHPLGGTPQPSTGQFFVDTGSGFAVVPVTEVSPNIYDATFPPIACGTEVQYYFTAESTDSNVVASPCEAPQFVFEAISSYGVGANQFLDDFEIDTGWTIQNSGITAGAWERGIPIDTSECADLFRRLAVPELDADGSGQCYLTQNDEGPNSSCNTDVDDGLTYLISPIIDATGSASLLTYWRWYSNTQGASPQADTFVVEISGDAGTNWQLLETVGPTTASPNPEVDGGWHLAQHVLSPVTGFDLNDQFMIRFTSSDLGNGSLVEAAIDGVRLQRLQCEAVCLGDISGDSVINVDDLLILIGAWGSCASCIEDLNTNGMVNVDDLLLLIANWGPCN